MLTPFEIQEAIETELDNMENLVVEMRAIAVETAEAEADFKIMFAQERLKARAEGQINGVKVTQDTAEDMATVNSKDARFRYLLAGNKLITCREAIKMSQSRLDGLRTLAASHRNTP